jgi:hypothetical protein
MRKGGSGSLKVLSHGLRLGKGVREGFKAVASGLWFFHANGILLSAKKGRLTRGQSVLSL